MKSPYKKTFRAECNRCGRIKTFRVIEDTAGETLYMAWCKECQTFMKATAIKLAL